MLLEVLSPGPESPSIVSSSPVPFHSIISGVGSVGSSIVTPSISSLYGLFLSSSFSDSGPRIKTSTNYGSSVPGTLSP